MNTNTCQIKFPRISPLGDQAFMITFGDNYSVETNSKVLEFDRKLAIESVPWIVEVVPAIRSILVRVDPLSIEMEKVEPFLFELLSKPFPDKAINQIRKFEIPVCYEGKFGPDLEYVATKSGLTKEKLKELHCSCNLRVACLGFAPGLTYLAQLPKEFKIPRKESYNTIASPGSILVANRQTVFTATEIPTGWSIIGRSPVIGFRVDQSPHFLLQPGDEIRFYPISEEEFSNFNPAQIWDTYGIA
ncbi:MAG: allophanate hydrolase subunit 1 [Rhodobacteraceae bacterium]|nr:allophanate hydrolase subunit 1 [Paracoccaceae bacterium]